MDRQMGNEIHKYKKKNTVKNLRIKDNQFWKMTKVLIRDRANIAPLKDNNVLMCIATRIFRSLIIN